MEAARIEVGIALNPWPGEKRFPVQNPPSGRFSRSHWHQQCTSTESQGWELGKQVLHTLKKVVLTKDWKRMSYKWLWIQEPPQMQVAREKEGRGKTGVWPPCICTNPRKSPMATLVLQQRKCFSTTLLSMGMQDELDLRASYHQKGQPHSPPPPSTHSHVTSITSSKKVAEDRVWISWLSWPRAGNTKDWHEILSCWSDLYQANPAATKHLRTVYPPLSLGCSSTRGQPGLRTLTSGISTDCQKMQKENIHAKSEF